MHVRNLALPGQRQQLDNTLRSAHDVHRINSFVLANQDEVTDFENFAHIERH